MTRAKRLVTAILVILFSLSGCGLPFASREDEAQSQPVKPVIGKGFQEKTPPAPAIPEETAELPTGILVMIDNQQAARPQSGIDKADIVYEIIAEGGITRYMALFYTQAADVIGPVRSARYYFVQLAKGYDLPYAHVGGAEDALSMIGNLKIKDINEISNARQYFWLDPSRKRPHSTYTSTAVLTEAITNKQYAFKVPELPPFAVEFAGEPLESGAVTLTYARGRYGYQAQWIWDETLGDGGQYRRYINGTAQSTADGIPLVADTVFVIAAPSGPRNTDPLTSFVEIVGGGEAFCVVENKIIRGTWKKESADMPLVISDADGQVMARKPGKTWIQVVDSMEEASLGQ